MSERTDDPRILDLIRNRWSPRAFDRSDIPQEDLNLMFEAAGLAPSASNIQPWRFLYARRGDENWERFLSLLVEANRTWAQDASVLVFLVSDSKSRRDDGSTRPNRTHSFDTGTAWGMLTLQALHMGYHTHGMAGLDYDRAARDLNVPEDHAVEMAFVIGRKAAKDTLPEKLQQREVISGRKPVGEIAKSGNLA